MINKGSSGFKKHLNEIVPRILQSNQCEKLSIITTKGVMDGFDDLGIDLHEINKDDQKSGFLQLGRVVEKGGYDVVFNLVARPIRIANCPIVTLVHNIEPIQKPSYAMPLVWRMRLWALRRECGLALRQAKRVLAVSNHMKNEICRRYNISQEIVNVIYHGFNINDTLMLCKPDLDIPDEFIFAAGSIVPYRGFEDIIRAMAVCQNNSIKTPPLVIAGGGVATRGAASYKKFLDRLAKELKISDKIIWAGELNRDEIAWCFQHNRVFIQPSRAEACPNIVLEAMGHGCLTISCNHPPMPEFFQETALYYPTGDATALSQMIKHVLGIRLWQVEEYKFRAKQRALDFCWEKTSAETMFLLESCCKKN
jgi:glycosyltransferase involved in cell wall biosynthesis